jgi:hypothetical protein
VLVSGLAQAIKEVMMIRNKISVGVVRLLQGILAVGLASGTALADGPAPGTPAEVVATYSSLADGILALKRTEENLCRSILAATSAHAHVALGRARKALATSDAKAAQTALEEVAADVAQLGTEGDNAVGAIRKKLIEAGQHHNSAGEAQGLYDEGYVIVTRAAKAKLLESSRAFAQMAQAPKAEALDAEWKKVEGVVAELLKPGK